MTPRSTVRYYEDVQVGEQFPSLRKEVTPPGMMAYGAATWDFNRLHYDTDYARKLGFRAPAVDGQMLGGILAQLVQDWAGPDAFLHKLSFRNRMMTYPGDSLTCSGVVTSKSVKDGEVLVECDLWMENQEGEKVLEPASAVVRFPNRGH